MHESPHTDPRGLAEGDPWSFGILGPVLAARDGVAVPLGAGRHRAVLAALLLSSNQPLTTAQLVDKVWGTDAPPTAAKMVHVYISRLRQAFGADAAMLVSDPSGYRLHVGDAQLDLARAERAAAEGRRLSAEDPLAAAARLQDALGQWRGPALADVRDAPFAVAAAARLDEFRRSVMDDRVAACLAAGQHRELLGELGERVAEEPVHERAHEHLMLALYRSGRQVEALDAYERYRRRLAGDLGLDPSPSMRRLHQEILTQDPALDAPTPTAATVPTVSPTGLVPPHTTRDTKRKPRRRRAYAAAAALLVVATTSAAYAFAAHDDHSSGTTVTGQRLVANSVAMLDTATGRVVADVPVGANPGAVVSTGSAIWVANREDRTVSRVDSSRFAVTKTFGLAAIPESLAVSGDKVWVANGFDGTVSRILAPYDELSSPFFPGPAVSGLLALAASSDRLWVALANGTLLAFDPTTLRQVATHEVQGHPGAAATGGDFVWVTQLADNSIERIDAKAARESITRRLAAHPQALVIADGSLWVACRQPDVLLRLDPASGRQLASFPLQNVPTSLAASGTTAWVAEGTSGELERLSSDPAVPPSTLRVGVNIGQIALSGTQLWIAIDPS